ncbi:ribonucleoside-diphosphate reductase small chain [Cinnamomum micranthum f. kanehirae]|uniref:Ribonucleoside-diphosphate reductase small chain n=1 Tax=Cinnamomum micranthum f. kanehirae TaxID=337451 RepID=A0A443P279_9MAGN|nr:ribonucleoside-diphosphate reductase small chain [Cinnamomum micranthum f. kanehirae]
MYKNAEASFTTEEIKLSQDPQHWATLAFFVASDGILLENLAARFMKEVQVEEARAFYSFQIAIENIHSEMRSRLLMCSLLLGSYIKDPAEKDRLFHAVETIPCVARIAEWALKWIDESEAFAERLIALTCVAQGASAQ